MNFFRSEEHMRNWAQFNPDPAIHVIMPLAGWMDRFSREQFQGRSRPDYVSWHTARRAQEGR